MIRLILAILILSGLPPRSVQESAPMPRGTGVEKGEVVPASPVAPGRSPAGWPDSLAPIPTETRLAGDGAPSDRNPSGGIGSPLTGGWATWYAADGMIAAAGPALREHLGRDWRGTAVRVTANGHTVVVRLTDWCACGKRHGKPTLLDLSDDAFRRLAPLSVGVIGVEVEPFALPETDALP